MRETVRIGSDGMSPVGCHRVTTERFEDETLTSVERASRARVRRIPVKSQEVRIYCLIYTLISPCCTLCVLMGLSATESTVSSVGQRPGVPGGSRPAGLGQLAVDRAAAVWWVGVHGGAGESTLERLFSGSCAAGHRWPIACDTAPVPAVVLVARTDARGLRAVQRAVRELVEHRLLVDLVGLVLMADAPGRLPRALRDLAGVVGGAVPRVWSMPWVEAWRAGEIPSPANSPDEAGVLAGDLRAVLGLSQKGRVG